MYMPLMIDIKKAVVFGGERGEGLQKIQKLAVYADELLCVPEAPTASPIVLEAGVQPLTEPTMILPARRLVPVAPEPASLANFATYCQGATFVSSDLLDRTLNEAIAAWCQEHGVLCNIIDTKDLCNTWFMSLIRHDHLQVAISSQGGCAFYSAQTRRELEPKLAWRNEVSRLLTALRLRVKKPADRYDVLAYVYKDWHFQRHLRAGRWTKADQRAEALRLKWEKNPPPRSAPAH